MNIDKEKVKQDLERSRYVRFGTYVLMETYHGGGIATYCIYKQDLKDSSKYNFDSSHPTLSLALTYLEAVDHPF